MNKKNIPMIVASVLLIIIAVALVWSAQKSLKSINAGSIYTNDTLGFQLTLPSNWDGKYKAITTSSTEVAFLVTTADPTWQNSNPFFPGYVELFGVQATSVTEWDMAVFQCQQGQDPTLCEDGLIGKNSQYAFTFLHPQDQPNDFAPFYFGGAEYLRQNFKALR